MCIRDRNGTDRTIVTPLVTAVGVIFGQDATNVVAAHGLVESAAKSNVAAFVTLPGVKDSLSGLLPDELDTIEDYLQDTITVEADVTELTCPQVMMACATSAAALGTDNVFDLSSLNDLTDGINQLNDAMSQLLDGASQLEDGTSQLSSGVLALLDGANTLNSGAAALDNGLGQLTDGLDIYLDRVPTKYDGLNATELAISESQERMAVVVERADMERFMDYCREENIEVTHVADVTDTRRMRMYNRDRLVVDLSREFIDSAGAAHYAEAEIGAVEACDPFVRKPQGATLAERMEADLADDNVVSQKGLVEMFDSTIGASTVLLPFGGRTQGSETQVSVQKLPVEGYTETASIMAYGYNPFLTSWSPYHGAAYAVVEACAKVVAAGAEFGGMRFSYQEYFERMHTARSWGKPLAALLGALRMQVELGLPSIGGKDSMSGTFQQINVPPMLMAFGITTVDARRVISTDLKEAGHTLYLLKHTPKANRMPDTAALRTLWNYASERIAAGRIVAGYAVGFGGVAEALAKMAFGNGIGAEVELPEEALFAYDQPLLGSMG